MVCIIIVVCKKHHVCCGYTIKLPKHVLTYSPLQ